MKKIIALFLILSFLSCKKDEPTCEWWVVDEWCEPILSNSGVYCLSYYDIDYKDCDGGHYEGQVVMYHSDSNVKNYRRFNHKK